MDGHADGITSARHQRVIDAGPPRVAPFRIYAEIPHWEVATGAPVIDGVAAFVDCRLAGTHEEGDHLIFIGEVVALGTDPEIEPLIFHGGSYRVLHPD